MGRLDPAAKVFLTYQDVQSPDVQMDGVGGMVAGLHHDCRVALDCLVDPDDGVFLESAFVRLRCLTLA